jgi:hypothetical protein
MADMEEEQRVRESDLQSQVSDLESRALPYEERIDELISTNTKLHEALSLGTTLFNGSSTVPCNRNPP